MGSWGESGGLAALGVADTRKLTLGLPSLFALGFRISPNCRLAKAPVMALNDLLLEVDESMLLSVLGGETRE